MGWRVIFQIIGLFLGVLGATILALPLIRVKRDLDDDLITWGAKKGGDYFYTRRGFLKDRSSGLWGLGFLGVGFLFQLLSVAL